MITDDELHDGYVSSCCDLGRSPFLVDIMQDAINNFYDNSEQNENRNNMRTRLLHVLCSYTCSDSCEFLREILEETANDDDKEQSEMIRKVVYDFVDQTFENYYGVGYDSN